MASNSDIEMRWVEAWSDLYDIAADRVDFPCLLPSGDVVDMETCKGWLQDAVYAGFLVEVRGGWVLGRQGAIVHKFLSI